MSKATSGTGKKGATLGPAKAVFEKPNRLKFGFNEAVGKTVKTFEYVTYIGLDTLELRFTDGTLLVIEICARPALDVTYYKDSDGDLKTLREYDVPAFFGGTRRTL
jgi:hypothetical protein